MTTIVRIIAVFVLVVSAFIVWTNFHDFRSLLDGTTGAPTTEPKEVPKVDWSADEKLIISSLDEKAQQIPPAMLNRVGILHFSKLSPVNTDLLYQHLKELNLWAPHLTSMNQQGDLILDIELHKSEDSLYLFYAVEEKRNRNRIFEVSDQKFFAQQQGATPAPSPIKK